ncbi:MAG: prephenate dehydrogenase [Thermodesulfovibrionia bacterium]
MNIKKVAIIGVGLIGGSFGLALKEIGFGASIIGIGRNEENLIRAKERGIIDGYTTIAPHGVEDADLILLATPVGRFEGIVNDIKDRIKKGAIVTDVGSVKTEVVRRLSPLMPDGVSFVGAHPIAGKESSGIGCASADIFKGTKCIITPAHESDNESIEIVSSIWKRIGSEVIMMTPEDHDLIYSAISHLPHIVAYSLVNTIGDIDSEFIEFAGQGFKDTTRIALSSPELWRDIVLFNRENLIRMLEVFMKNIDRIKGLLEKEDSKAIKEEFERAREFRERLK